MSWDGHLASLSEVIGVRGNRYLKKYLTFFRTAVG